MSRSSQVRCSNVNTTAGDYRSTALCLVNSEAGFDTTRVLMAGHSLGGIVMKSYVDEHPDKASAILLFGSYLDDTDSDSNIFPVPVLTAVGNLVSV